MDFWKSFYKKHSDPSFKKQLKGVLGYSPGNPSLYKTALTHRSVKDTIDENNERLEYLGDAVLSALVADYLFKRYPYKEEGFLTEMRSKMVNRQKLNEIALKMGLKKITFYNKFDNALKISQIFGNTLEISWTFATLSARSARLGAGWLSAPPVHRERQAMTTATGHKARNSRQGFV